MSDSEALVARVEGDDAWLDVCKPADCENCDSSDGCGLGRGKRLQRVRNTIGARVGDIVIVTVPGGAVLKAAFFSYLLPLAAALLGATVGMKLAGESGALIGVLVGLVLGIAALRVASGRLAAGGEPLLAMRIKPVVVQLHRKQES